MQVLRRQLLRAVHAAPLCAAMRSHRALANAAATELTYAKASSSMREERMYSSDKKCKHLSASSKRSGAARDAPQCSGSAGSGGAVVLICTHNA